MNKKQVNKKPSLWQRACALVKQKAGGIVQGGKWTANAVAAKLQPATRVLARVEYSQADGLPAELQTAWRSEIDLLYGEMHEIETEFDAMRGAIPGCQATPEELALRKTGSLQQRRDAFDKANLAFGKALQSELTHTKLILCAMGLDKAQIARVGAGETDLARQVLEDKIQREALCLVATRGVPIIPPGLSAEEENLFEEATKEPDPYKRSLLFASAEKRFRSK